MCGWIEGRLEAIGLGGRQVITRGNQRLYPEALLSAPKSLLGSNEMGAHERVVSRNGNHRCLRNEPPHECLFGLLESFCTSAVGIYHRYGKVALAST